MTIFTRKTFYLSTSLLLLTLVYTPISSASNHIDYAAGPIAFIKRTLVQIPDAFHIPYNGTHKEAFPKGFQPGIGSSIAYKFKDAKNNQYFYVLSDRGPNSEAPSLSNGTRAQIFPTPHFVPFIGIVRVSENHEATLIDTIPISTSARFMSGLPLPPKYSHQQVVPLSETLLPLQFDMYGIDPESITSDQNGHIWISEEYVPSIIEVSPDKGQMIRRLSPGDGLPEILKERQTNRGFESIAATPNGKIYSVMESTLDVNQETKSSAQFIRVVEFNPKNGLTRMFAYPIEPGLYIDNAEVKIGDISAINNHEFLIIEQGITVNGSMQNNVFKITMKHATDISDIALEDDQALEYGTLDDLKPVKMIKKHHLFNLRDYGWQPKKLEGITYIDDKTIAVTNDNDFGMAGTSIASEKTMLTNYRIDENQSLQFCGDVVQGESLKLQPKKPHLGHTHLWIIHLTKPLSEMQ